MKLPAWIFKYTLCRIGVHHGRCDNGVYTCDHCDMKQRKIKRESETWERE